jgi:hypothetical protein
MQHMTNIPAYGTLIKERSASIQEQIENLPQDHPLCCLKRAIDNEPKKSRFKNLLLLKISTSGTYKKFKERQETQPTLSLPTFLQKERERLNAKSPLVCYTLPSSVQSKSQTDIVFRITDPQTQFNALRWRKNNLGYANRIFDPDKRVKCSHCKVCKTIWNRNHVQVCPVVINQVDIDRDKWNRFKREQSAIRDRHPHAKHFTILDSLLNNADFYTFQTVFIAVEKNLERTFSYEPIRIKITTRSPQE